MDDEGLRELKADVFYNQIGYLSDELGDPERYFPSLKARGILDETDCETIRSRVTSREKVDTFVEIVHKRESSTGDPALDVFVDLLLSQVVQAHIARALQQAFANRKRSVEGRGQLNKSSSKSLSELPISEGVLGHLGPEALMKQEAVDCHESSSTLTSLGVDSSLGSVESSHMTNGGLVMGRVRNGGRPSLQHFSMSAHHNPGVFDWKRTSTDPRHSRPPTRDDQHLLQQSLPTGLFHQPGFTRTRTQYGSRNMKVAAPVLPQPSIEEEATENYGYECAICMEKYDVEGARAPRSLTCGHTYCTGERQFTYMYQGRVGYSLFSSLVKSAWVVAGKPPLQVCTAGNGFCVCGV